MKRTFISGVMLLTASLMLTSCFSYTTVVGKGAQGNEKKTSWNHYAVFGLAPVAISDPGKMAGGAEDYTVTTKHSFINGLVAGLTLGLYNPTTTVVTR